MMIATCQEVLIATDVAYISWAVGTWTLDETRSCYEKPVYYKAVAKDGGPMYAGYTSNAGAGYMLQPESSLCINSGYAYSNDRTPSDLSEAGSTWRYHDGSDWTIDSTFATSCKPTINISNILNWEDLKAACSSNGKVILSDDFVMGTYTPTPAPQLGGIDFSGKQLVIIGNNKTLDAGTNG
jgi:hypothetical protein